MLHALFIDPDLTWLPVINRAKERGIMTIAIQSERYAQAYPSIQAIADRHQISDTTKQQDLENTFRSIGALTPTAIFTSNDAVLNTVAIAAENLKIPFTSSKAVSLARNKHAMRQELRALGFEMPRTEIFESLNDVGKVAERIGYPCVIKPCSGHQSWLCFRLLSFDDVEDVVEELQYMVENLHIGNQWSIKNGFICEEWLEGPVISVSIAATKNGLIPVSVALGTVSEDAPCSGFGSVIPYIENPLITLKCEDYAISICRALGLNLGMFDLEMAWTSGGPILIEVNARRMGGVMPLAFEMATKINFSDYLIDAYFNQPIQRPDQFTQTAVIRKIISTEKAQLGQVPDHSWWAEQGDNLFVWNYSMNTGRQVQALEVIARVILISENHTAAFLKLNEIVTSLEEITGTQFLRGRLPSPLVIQDQIDTRR